MCYKYDLYVSLYVKDENYGENHKLDEFFPKECVSAIETHWEGIDIECPTGEIMGSIDTALGGDYSVADEYGISIQFAVGEDGVVKEYSEAGPDDTIYGGLVCKFEEGHTFYRSEYFIDLCKYDLNVDTGILWKYFPDERVKKIQTHWEGLDWEDEDNFCNDIIHKIMRDINSALGDDYTVIEEDGIYAQFVVRDDGAIKILRYSKVEPGDTVINQLIVNFSEGVIYKTVETLDEEDYTIEYFDEYGEDEDEYGEDDDEKDEIKEFFREYEDEDELIEVWS